VLYGLAADVIVLLHAGFVAFVVAGAALVLRWPRVAWFHVPAAIWGAVVELAGWVCPLTPLEVALRRQAGHRGYDGDFVEQYILPMLYPDWLTRPTQLVLGLLVIVVNVALYAVVARRRRTVTPHGRTCG
jgi:hypothetical protein